MASQNSKNKSTGSARRARSDSPDLTSTKKQCTLEIRETTPVDPDHWPRFLVLHATDEEKPLTSLSPFAIAKGIQGLAGVAKQIKPMPSGDLLVEVTKRAHCENLLRSTTLVNVNIRVTPHRTLNTSRGVIYCPNLKVCDDTELEEELKAQGVGHIRCITRRTPDAIVKTGSYILTFNTPHLPEYILAGYLNIRVNCFIPNPLRCFNCQKFGHGANRCRHKKVCAKCGQQEHDFENCPNDPKCVNCGGPHPSSAKTCPQWLNEKEVQKHKSLNNCSFKEAREVVESKRPANTVGSSYATVVKPTTKDSSTQTDIGVQADAADIDRTMKIVCQTCHCTPSTSKPTQTVPITNTTSTEITIDPSSNSIAKITPVNPTPPKETVKNISESNSVKTTIVQISKNSGSSSPKKKKQKKPPGPKEGQVAGARPPKGSDDPVRDARKEAVFTDDEEDMDTGVPNPPTNPSKSPPKHQKPYSPVKYKKHY